MTNQARQSINTFNVATIDITKVKKSETGFTFYFDYDLKDEVSGELLDWSTRCIFVSNRRALLKDNSGEFDIRNVFDAVLLRDAFCKKGLNIGQISVVIRIDGVSSKSYEGIGSDLPCPVVVFNLWG